MAARTYITRQGDVLDLICWHHYGTSARTTELVLEANPHLRDQPVRLPSGLSIVLPAYSVPPKRRIKLWD